MRAGKTCIYITLTVFVIRFVEWLVTMFGIRDRVTIKEADRLCVIEQTRQLLHNPIERIIIVKTVVERRSGSAIYTGSYTLFGIKYAEVKAVCNGPAKVTWRRWFGR